MPNDSRDRSHHRIRDNASQHLNCYSTMSCINSTQPDTQPKSKVKSKPSGQKKKKDTPPPKPKKKKTPPSASSSASLLTEKPLTLEPSIESVQPAWTPRQSQKCLRLDAEGNITYREKQVRTGLTHSYNNEGHLVNMIGVCLKFRQRSRF